MKHLKKLSVALMMTTLLSASFTSCLDADVSPVVEAIYEAQADLIAAQTAVQNAEANLRNAEAAHEQADADFRDAQTARVVLMNEDLANENDYNAAEREQKLMELVAETAVDVNAYENELALAKEQFKIDMENLLAELAENGVQIAIDYAFKYAAAMNHADGVMSDLNTANKNLAIAELMLVGNAGDEISTAFHLAGLENNVATLEAKIVYITDMLTMLNEDAADPMAVIEDLEAQLHEIDLQEDAVDILIQEQQNIIDALYDEDQLSDAAESVNQNYVVDEYNSANNSKNSKLASIEAATANIAAWTTAMNDYAATLVTLKADADAAKLRVGARDFVHSGVVEEARFGLLGDIETKEEEVSDKNDEVGDLVTAMGVYGAAPVLPGDAGAYRAGTKPQDVLWNADLALLEHQAAFAALNATYNAAATAYAAAQALYDANDYDGDLLAAQTAESDFIANGYQDAVDAYDAALAAFTAEPAGDQVTDSDGNHSDNFVGYLANYNSTFDLGETGIHTDLAPDTYMRVLTWKETTLGSNQYIPATLGTEKYNTADLAVEAAALIADGGNLIANNADIWLWDDTAQMDVNDIDGNLLIGDYHTFSVANATLADSEDIAVFINVENDDSSVSNEIIFNAAANMLGSENFADRAIIGDISDPDYMAPLVVGDANASYNSANPETLGGNDTLTAEAELWNLKLAAAVAEYTRDNAEEVRQDAQDAFDAQQLLFDEGLQTESDLEDDIDAADDLVDDQQDLIDDANDELSDLNDELTALEDELGSKEYLAIDPTPDPLEAWQVVRDYTDANKLPMSWDVHANDGLATDIVEVKNSAMWDSTDDGDADSLTAYAALWNAENLMLDHMATTPAMYQSMITGAEANIADWTNEIANLQPVIDALKDRFMANLPNLTVYGLEFEYEFDDVTNVLTFDITNDGEFNNVRPEIYAQIIAAYKIFWNLQAQETMLQNEKDYIDALLDEYDDQYDNLFGDIDDFEDDLADAEEDLENAKAALALALVDEDAATAHIAYLQALVSTLETRHATAVAVAAQYKALMEAALNS